MTYEDGTSEIKKDSETILKDKSISTITIVIDEEEKRKTEELDGCYAVKTSLTDTSKDTKEDIHSAYKTLIKVENAFKILKTEYLEIRPLYLRTDSSIIGHTVVSMLAYNIVLKLKEYITLSKLDFKSTIREFGAIKTTINRLNNAISTEYIPRVKKELRELFEIMKFKLPTRL